MAQFIPLKAEARESRGKGGARATRRADRIPAVIYGDKKPAVTISLTPNIFIKQLHHPAFFTNLFEIELGGEKHQVMAKDIQMHPVSEMPLHVDFLRVNEKTELHVEVPVHVINQEKSPGLKAGGVLNMVRHELQVACRMNDIPHEINVDVSTLEMGDSLHIEEVTLPAGVRVINTSGKNFTVVTVNAPKKEVEEAPTAEGAEGEAATPAAEGDKAKEGAAKEEKE